MLNRARVRYARLISSAGLVLALVATSCGGTSTAGGGSGAKGPVNIGAIIDETGANASVGPDQLGGLNAYINNINATGGVDGHQIKINVMDSQSMPTVAVQDYHQLVSDSSNVVMIGPTFTAAGILVLPLTAQDQIPYLAPVVTDSFMGPWFFRTIPSNAIDALSLLQYAKSQGDTQIGLLYPNESQGISGAQDIMAAAPGLGMTIVASQSYPSNTLDPTVEIDKVRAANPQAYIVNDGSNLDRLTLTIRTMRSIGITQIIGTELPASSPAFVTGVQGRGSGVNGVYFWAFSAPGQNTNSDEAAFQTIYEKTSSGHAAADSFALIGAMWGEMIVGAIKELDKQGKPITRANMKTAFGELTGLVTVLGTLQYTPTQHDKPFNSTVIIVYNAQGQQILGAHG